MDAYFEFEKPIVTLEKKLLDLRELSKEQNVSFDTEIEVLEKKLHSLIDDVYSKLSPLQRVQLSRHPARPYASDYISLIFGENNFIELHGDRYFGDDAAIVGGLTKLEGTPVLVIGQQKGRNTKQKIERNFGMARPEGYRKALRLMHLAARFQIPIITLIDTPGAYPGIDAEERGQAEAIARCIMEMFGLETPIIACVIGEGGSGGALAIGIADRVLMMEYSTYSVISPESCASILWSDSTQNELAAKILKITSRDIAGFEVVDGVVPEPKGGAHRDWKMAAESLKKALLHHLKDLSKQSPKQLVNDRLQKFRDIGHKTFTEKKAHVRKKT